MLEFLGSGAYGTVCSAQIEDSSAVAIKKCKKIFQSKTMAKRTLREIRLLRLCDHDNVVKIIKILDPIDHFNFAELYIGIKLFGFSWIFIFFFVITSVLFSI